MLKVAVIGVGNISQSHIDAYRQNPDVELYALCDINEKTLKAKGERYGITKLYTDCETMFRELPEIDLVSVCTWNSAHKPCVIAALNAGKNVLCEKPMALNAKDAEEMRAAAVKNKKLLAVGFVRRFGRDAKMINELRDNGRLGEVYYAKANYIRRNGNPGGWFGDKSRSGGGPLIDLGVHVIDLVRYLEGCPKPVSVYGATFTKLYNRSNIKSDKAYVSSSYDGKNDICDVEDLATAMIRFDNGSVLQVDTSFSLNTGADSGKIELFGEKGGVRLDPSLTYFSEMDDRLVDVTFAQPTDFDFGNAFQAEIDCFVSAVKSGTPLIADANDGVEMMKILDAIYESAKTGHEVIIG